MIKLKEVNLIPKEVLRKPLLKQLEALYRKNPPLQRFAKIAAVIILISFMQLLFLGIFTLSFNSAKSRMQSAKVQLNQMQSKYISLEKLKLDLTKQDLREKERLDELVSTSSEGKRYAQLLVYIAGLLPSKDLWITRFALGELEIQVQGATLNNELIPQFMAKLDESGMFKNSRFASSEKQVVESHNIYNFQIMTDPVWGNIGGNN